MSIYSWQYLIPSSELLLWRGNTYVISYLTFQSFWVFILLSFIVIILQDKIMHFIVILQLFSFLATMITQKSCVKSSHKIICTFKSEKKFPKFSVCMKDIFGMDRQFSNTSSHKSKCR